MTSVKPLYDHVQATVLEGLRREWQRYGWEDSEIDDKVDKLAKLWAAALHNTGAVTDPPQPQQTAGQEEKDEVGADGKRKRKREEKPGEKRFKSGPRVDAPLTYPTFPPAPAAASSASLAQPAALPSGYVPRFPSPSPSPSPQPSSVTTAPVVSRAMPAANGSSLSSTSSSTASSSAAINTLASEQLDRNIAAAQQLFHTQPNSVLAKAAVTDGADVFSATSTSALHSTSHSSMKSELPLPPLPIVPFSASSSIDNPLLTEPLSTLDDDSDVDVELGSVKDLVLCQYERVQHQKGRWKIAMRDGIVSVKGKEYAFSRLTGELQW